MKTLSRWFCRDVKITIEVSVPLKGVDGPQVLEFKNINPDKYDKLFDLLEEISKLKE